MTDGTFTRASLQLLQRHQITEDQRFLLRTRPALELALTFETDGPSVVLFYVRESDRTPGAGVRRRATFVVLGNSFGDIAGFADVERIVDAAQDIDKPHATTMPSSRVLWKRR